MNRRLLIIALAITGLITAGSVAFSVLWLIPKLHALRVSIDNDRATTALVQQQQSNIDKLSQDLDSITKKQKALENDVWQFLSEDSFFTFIDTVAKHNAITIDTPAIADATPNGTILTRSVTLTLRGGQTKVLSAVSEIQSHTPLIALQRFDLKGGASTDSVTATITAVTLWK